MSLIEVDSVNDIDMTGPVATNDRERLPYEEAKEEDDEYREDVRFPEPPFLNTKITAAKKREISSDVKLVMDTTPVSKRIMNKAPNEFIAAPIPFVTPFVAASDDEALERQQNEWTHEGRTTTTAAAAAPAAAAAVTVNGQMNREIREERARVRDQASNHNATYIDVQQGRKDEMDSKQFGVKGGIGIERKRHIHWKDAEVFRAEAAERKVLQTHHILRFLIAFSIPYPPILFSLVIFIYHDTCSSFSL